ncbi:hypothetical protein FRC0456_01031 [Corynebacterium diphtheriae]|uniref:phage tail termination protein n=1 Tax=Corynebacterium diphtheriae TaxID=1717 RepID=UPI000D05E107|nr:hypothetical protein [Corynebacterium diphtheriae]MBG9335760.1 hypothetical protein [Corynebacterium diphtheriae bv. gravis]PSA74258.1 hypothetical protein BT092_04695 [Corynebacterium diphtheriae]CAB0503303.1 hypothetical protein FRC061569_00905 [Corynebacterium diphtheriae]CAB0507308.1 hypothetical protein FRC020322_01147 [Corynebacterium diphtheriae]CAB0507507.1 hypothetical protein FRC031641_01144 [Corynebacterium diphtheriae]
MTNPPHITVPDDQRFPDVEILMVTVMNTILQKLTPAGSAYIIPPNAADAEQLINAGHCIATATGFGGVAERTQDHPRVLVTVTTAYRSDSTRVLQWLRRQLTNFNGTITTPEGDVTIQDISDAQGPQRLPAPQLDHRTAQAFFTVTTRLLNL